MAIRLGSPPRGWVSPGAVWRSDGADRGQGDRTEVGTLGQERLDVDGSLSVEQAPPGYDVASCAQGGHRDQDSVAGPKGHEPASLGARAQMADVAGMYPAHHLQL